MKPPNVLAVARHRLALLRVCYWPIDVLVPVVVLDGIVTASLTLIRDSTAAADWRSVHISLRPSQETAYFCLLALLRVWRTLIAVLDP